MSANGTATLVKADHIDLHLRVDEGGELYDSLSSHPDGPGRNHYALDAMRVGSVALEHARSRVDTERIRSEGDRLIESLGHALDKHQSEVTKQVSGCLQAYFDPANGMFPQRIQMLLGDGGEMEQMIRRQVDGDSTLSRTLAEHVGQSSALMRAIAPESADGILARMSAATEAHLANQRHHILREFSLDNRDGALARLVQELKSNHGEVGKALENRIDAITQEFSLDSETSALSRLVRRVEQTQREVSAQFSLDNDGSALARMRRELMSTLAEQQRKNDSFHAEVVAKLAEMTARKQESERSTRHGEVFEDMVFQFIRDRCQHSGDVATHTGASVGRIKNCKKGDVVIQMGPDHAAAGARIVVEAKENASYNLNMALVEMDEARRNRDAQVGLFVFSARTAPAGTASFTRYGQVVVIVWEPESDVMMDAGLSVTRAICVQERAHSEMVGADIKAIEQAILDIQKQAEGLDQVNRWAETIRTNSDRILKSAGTMRQGLDRQVQILTEKVGGLQA